jgi:hypothetical protein
MTISFSVLKAKSLLISAVLISCCLPAQAAEIHVENVTISRIRSVGDFSAPMYANAIEIWFVAPVNLPAGMGCPALAYRVAVDAKHKHLIAAVYLAFSMGKKININFDDRLPIRGDMCEASYVDVVN